MKSLVKCTAKLWADFQWLVISKLSKESQLQIFIYQNLSSYMLGDPVFGAGN